MITDFLSEESVALHKEYLRQKRLKYSILESCIPRLHGASVSDLFKLKLDKRDRADALELLPEIVLHDLYFSSFSEEKYPASPLVRELYGSEASFLSELYGLAKNRQFGFLAVYGASNAKVVTDYADALRYHTPTLAVDLCEHAYFTDYGFDGERYLVAALSYLDLTKLTT